MLVLETAASHLLLTVGLLSYHSDAFQCALPQVAGAEAAYEQRGGGV